TTKPPPKTASATRKPDTIHPPPSILPMNSSDGPTNAPPPALSHQTNPNLPSRVLSKPTRTPSTPSPSASPATTSPQSNPNPSAGSGKNVSPYPVSPCSTAIMALAN